MTRIIAGRWGGRRLTTVPGQGTRPTSDRVREAMFASLQSEFGGFDDLAVLDLYAGSGALALEALSRGARSADLVESDRRAANVIRTNVESLAADSARVHAVAVERFLATASQSYDLVLADPPYADEIAPVLAAIPAVLNPGAVVVVERSTRTEMSWPEGLVSLREKAYGETTLWYGRARD